MTITTSHDPAGPAKAPKTKPGLDRVGPAEARDARAGFDRASWRESAACRDAETELFFPISKVGPAVAETSRAKEICAGCPVRQACLTYALATNQVYGIWGGYDEDERRVLRRRQQRAARAAVAVPAARAAKG